MTDYPIIMSAPMVGALVAGRKTMTRRLASSRTWPRVRPGDRLWVRETWCKRADGLIAYRAGPPPWDVKHDVCKWHPSIHMRRCHSRLTLLVTAAHVEPLRGMSHADAIREGIRQDREGDDGTPLFGVPGLPVATKFPVNSFAQLWDSLHCKCKADWNDCRAAGRCRGFYTNPDVVVLGFAVVNLNIADVRAGE